MPDNIITYFLSALCIVLGFIALLRQKTYIDTNTNTPTEIDLPLIGKLKTNIPALAFLLAGAGLAFFAFHERERAGHTHWSISGQLLANPGDEIQWENGELKLLPESYYPRSVNSDGTFDLEVDIPRGLAFEDAYDSIVYVYRTNTNEPRSYQIVTRDPSLLKSKTNNSRQYRQ